MDSKTAVEPKKLQVMDLGERAAAICEMALNEARLKLPKVFDEMKQVDLLADPTYMTYFKNEIANLVADEIVQNDGSIQSIHIFNPEMNPGSEDVPHGPIDLNLHLICVTPKPSAALNALVAGLDRGITTAINGLPTTRYSHLETVLDVIFITQKEIHDRKGYAALLSSIFAPPLQIWP